MSRPWDLYPPDDCRYWPINERTAAASNRRCFQLTVEDVVIGGQPQLRVCMGYNTYDSAQQPTTFHYYTPIRTSPRPQWQMVS